MMMMVVVVDVDFRHVRLCILLFRAMYSVVQAFFPCVNTASCCTEGSCVWSISTRSLGNDKVHTQTIPTKEPGINTFEMCKFLLLSVCPTSKGSGRRLESRIPALL